MPVDNRLIDALRAKRKEIADAEGKPLYMILQNATIEATVAAMPKTKEDLAVIKGWGKKKIEKFGDAVLHILNGNHTTEDILFDEGAAVEPPKANSLTVGEFLHVVNTKLAEIGTVRVQGEIGRVNVVNGNAYFTLKDSDAAIDCFMGRWNVDRYGHILEEGIEIVVTGAAGVYKNGRFNISAERIDPVGEGALRIAFERLKQKLEEKGYFDPERKRSLPSYIRSIGVITSATGAVINDFRRNIGEYGFKIYHHDVRVEGDTAEADIVRAIRWMNLHMQDLDVLVLIRGGGSLESLQAFNSEAVADAVMLSRIPIATGIGHEPDETIVGFTADRNFSTPTAVAVFIRTQHERLIQYAREQEQALVVAAERLFEERRHYAERMMNQLAHSVERVFGEVRSILNIAGERMTTRIERTLTSVKNRLAVAEASLVPLDPKAIMERGYSVATASDGRVLKDAKQIKQGDRIFVTLWKGRLKTSVEEIHD